MTTTKTKPTKGASGLPELGKVKYEYIPRRNSDIPNKSHPLYDGMLDGTIITFSPLRTRTGQFALTLNEAEIEFISKGLGIEPSDLNAGNMNNEYLSNLTVELPKSGLNLDTTIPYDLLRDRILVAYNNFISPNLASKDEKAGSYRFVRIAGDEEVITKNKKSDLLKEAYKALGTLEEDRNKMYMYMINTGARVPYTIKDEDLKALVNDTAEKDFSKFLAALEDPLFVEKGLLRMASIMGVVSFTSNMFYYDNKPLAAKGDVAEINTAAMYLKAKDNGDIRLAISKQTLDKFNKGNK